MTSGEENEGSNEHQDRKDDDTAFGTEEECLNDAEACNARMEEGGTTGDDNTNYFDDDTSFDAQLDDLDWDSGDDPFDAQEWQMIHNNLEP